MLVPSSNIAGVSYRPATDKQAMMCGVQTRGMGHRASGDWPLGDHGAFFEINDRNMAVTSHNISHRDVQSFSRRLDCDARGIAPVELNAAQQFDRFGYFVRGSANGYNSAICQGHPDFIGVGEIEWLLRHS